MTYFNLRLYHFKAKNSANINYKGSLFAQSEQHLYYQLQQKQLVPVSITANEVTSINYYYYKPSMKQLITFTRQMSIMLNAGFPLITAIKQQEHATSNLLFNGVINYIEMRLQQGYSLTDTIKNLNPLFSESYCQIISVGEHIGDFAMSFEKLSLMLAGQLRSQQKLKAALRYPILMISIAIMALLLISQIVMPEFEKMYLQFDVELPLLTRWTLVLFNKISILFIVLFTLSIPFVSLYYYAYQNKKVKVWIHKHLLTCPLSGKLLQRYYLILICQSLQLMLTAGIPLLQALKICQNLLTNIYLKEYLKHVEQLILQGEPFGQALHNHYLKLNRNETKATTITDFIDPHGKAHHRVATLVIQQIIIGEQSGKLPLCLAQIVDIYQQELQESLQQLETLLEPMTLFIVGIIVAFIIVAMYLPTLNLGAIVG